MAWVLATGAAGAADVRLASFTFGDGAAFVALRAGTGSVAFGGGLGRSGSALGGQRLGESVYVFTPLMTQLCTAA